MKLSVSITYKPPILASYMLSNPLPLLGVLYVGYNFRFWCNWDQDTYVVVCLLLCTSFGSFARSSCDTNGLVRRNAQK